ncbi:DUF418 domain-containing protein [Streptomyces sp. 24-1644]|uniref:DUF418 domain-containing protein n=1 Tax=Streptomyces sp. 24-1644 TaxID=3457315 RepID=UPI003FA70347
MTAPLGPSPAAPPVARIGDIDVLRGFALLGILLINAQLMAGPATTLGGGAVAGLADRGAAWVLTALVAGKFYLLFSFLFGYGFTLQQRSAEHASVAFGPRHLRRTAALFLLGLAHAVLLYPGDILMTYAVLGLVLFALRAVPPRTLLRIAAGLLGTLVLLFLVHGLFALALTGPERTGAATTAAGTTTAGPTTVGPTADLVAAYRGGPGSVLLANLRLLPEFLAANMLYSADLLAAFLAGLAAGRWRASADPGHHRARMRRIVRRGLPFGLAGGLFMAACTHGPLDSGWFHIGQAAGVLTAPALTAAYACGVLLLVRTPAGRKLARALAPAGRMSLTNYLTQSFVLALVFTGYGLGLYGRIGTATVLAGCLVLYAVQLALSALLLKYLRSGPAEYVLRAATRGGFPQRTR